MVAGIKLPGLEFRNQRVEAAYRKELVYGEDDAARAKPPTVAELFANVRRNYFRLYFHYVYFNVVRYTYLQADNIFSLLILVPTIVAGTITLGLLNQIIMPSLRLASSFQYPGQLLADDRRAFVDPQAPARVRGDAGRRSPARDRPPFPRTESGGGREGSGCGIASCGRLSRRRRRLRDWEEEAVL